MLFLYNQQNLKNFKFFRQKNISFLLRGYNFNKFLMEDLIVRMALFFLNIIFRFL